MKKMIFLFLCMSMGTMVRVSAETFKKNCTDQSIASDTTISGSHNIFINDVRLTDEQVTALENLYHTKINNNNYWYDQFCGAWGIQGSPALGFIHPGLNIGGAMREDASNGNTNVYVNGRRLHQWDVLGLQQLGPVQPGRYWVDAWGNFGFEGGMARGNLWALVRQRMATGAKGGGPWACYSGRTDGGVNVVGGNGQDDQFAQFGSDFWYPGK